MAVGDPKKHPAGTSPAFPRPGKRSRIPLSFKKTAESAKGADVNAKDKDGETPLDEAINYEEIETADLLRKRGGKTGSELKVEGK